MVSIDNKNTTTTIAQPSKRNSLMELYRFLFALWVVWYHGYFLFKNQYFDHGYMAVEFFFILSGFYLLRAISRHQTDTFFGGLWKMLWRKLKSLGFTFVIGVVFVYWHMAILGEPVLFGYLWYIPIMLLASAVVYTLKRLIKNNIAFVVCLAVLVVVSYLILYIPVLEKFGVLRGIGAVSIGVLISMIPKISLRVKGFSFNLLITIMLIAVIAFLACWPKEDLVSEYFLVLLLMPALVYFTSTVKVNIKFFNFLGSISFALYAYQCVLRVLRCYFELESYYFFLILIALVAVDTIVKALIKRSQNRKTALAKA
jgi:peptidoglycan/LPS O-acetylase OafA/YrhL